MEKLFKDSLFENEDVCVDFLNKIVNKFKPGYHSNDHFEMYASGEYLSMIIPESIAIRKVLYEFLLDVDLYKIKEEELMGDTDRSEIGFYTLIQAYAEHFPGKEILWSEEGECFKCSSDFDLIMDNPNYFD